MDLALRVALLQGQDHRGQQAHQLRLAHRTAFFLSLLNQLAEGPVRRQFAYNVVLLTIFIFAIVALSDWEDEGMRECLYLS